MIQVADSRSYGLRLRASYFSSSIPLLVMTMTLMGLGLWLASVWRQPLRLNGYGLLPSLNVWYYIGTILCIGSFGIGVFADLRNRWLLTMALGAVIVTLYLTPIMLEHTARFTFVYTSYGYADYIVRHHTIAPTQFIYQNWPLHHVLVALAVMAGVKPMVLLMLGPVFFAFAFATLIWLVARLFSRNEQVAWSAAGFLIIASPNVYYVLPLTTGLLLSLATLALLLSSWRGNGFWSKHPHWAMAAAIVTGISTITTHLLSSIYLILLLFGLAIFNRIGLARGIRAPFLILVVALVIWQFYIAAAWTNSTIPQVVQSAFRVDNIAQQTQQFALGGSQAHTRVVYVKLAMYAFILITASVAWITNVIGEKRLTAATAILVYSVIAPFLLALVTSYSGEIISRALGLAMPFLAISAAMLSVHRPGKWLLAIVSMVLVLVYPIYAYGNELVDYVSPSEIDASQYLIDYAPAEFTVTNKIERTIRMGAIERQYKYSQNAPTITFKGQPFERARAFYGIAAGQDGTEPACNNLWYINKEVEIYLCPLAVQRKNIGAMVAVGP